MTRRRSIPLPVTLAATVSTAALLATTPAVAAPITPGTLQQALTQAQRLLANARADLAEARAAAAAVRRQAALGVVDVASVAAGQRPHVTAATSDIELIAGLVDPQDPNGALRSATIAELSELDGGTPSAGAQPAARTPQQALVIANRSVARAAERAASARALVQQITNPGTADGPGAAELARKCAAAGVVIEQCQPVRWTEGHLQYDTVMIGRTVNVTWPAVKVVGGWRPSDPYPDHPSGRAADIMMPNAGQGSDVALGNAIARYFQQHADEYGIDYMIWRQRQWQAGTPFGAWNSMSDRGSAAANHFDHVHITVTDGHSGTAFQQLVKQARATGLSLGA